MKTILRSLFLNGIVLYLAAAIYPGLVYDGKLVSLVFASVAITLLNTIVKPLIKLLLLPINLLTMGIFGWVSHVLTLFVLTLLVEGFSISSFTFTGFNYNGFVVPRMEFGMLMSYIIASIVLSMVAQGVSWMLKD